MEDIRVNSNILAVLSFNPPLGFAATAVIAIILISFPTFLLAYNRRARKNDQKITDATLTSDIMRVAIAACLTVMFFMPCIVSTATLQAVSATDVFIAVDVTGSMGVKDAQYGSSEKISRIAAAKKAIEDIVNLHADASFSAIRFGSETIADLPLTPDSRAVLNWAEQLRTEPASVSKGSSLDAPISTLATLIKDQKQRHPDDHTVLYYISDGEQTSAQSRSSFSGLRGYVSSAEVIGTGSAEGGQIPLTYAGIAAQTDRNSGSEEDAYVNDPVTGQPGISKMSEETLKTIADEMSGKQITVGENTVINELNAAQNSSEYRISKIDRNVKHSSPIIWPFAVAAFILLMFETCRWILDTRRSL